MSDKKPLNSITIPAPGGKAWGTVEVTETGGVNIVTEKDGRRGLVTQYNGESNFSFEMFNTANGQLMLSLRFDEEGMNLIGRNRDGEAKLILHLDKRGGMFTHIDPDGKESVANWGAYA